MVLKQPRGWNCFFTYTPVLFGRKVMSHMPIYVPVLVSFIVNLTKPRVTWEERSSVEEFPLLEWHIALAVRNCLDVERSSPLWVAPSLGECANLYKKTNRTQPREQASGQYSSMVSASVSICVPSLTSLSNEA